MASSLSDRHGRLAGRAGADLKRARAHVLLCDNAVRTMHACICTGMRLQGTARGHQRPREWSRVVHDSCSIDSSSHPVGLPGPSGDGRVEYARGAWPPYPNPPHQSRTEISATCARRPGPRLKGKESKDARRTVPSGIRPL